MKSIALFYKQTDDKTDASTPLVELHLNIWKVEEDRLLLKSVFYIDFGLKIPFSIDRLQIYVPFQCSDMVDLGHFFGHKPLLDAVFNENYTSTCLQNQSYYEVKAENKTQFFIYKLGENNISCSEFNESGYQGNKIEINVCGSPVPENDISSLDASAKIRYVRFRLKVKEKKELLQTEYVSNDLLQAAFSKTDLFDIRVNEMRVIHDKIIEQSNVDGYKACRFSKVHLFYMADTKDTIINGSSLKVDSRMLEKEYWKDYEPVNSLKEVTYIAHHWRKKRASDKDELDKFTLFFSTVYPSLNLSRLLAYLVTVILVGSVASFLVSDMNEWFKDRILDWLKPFLLIAMIVYLVVYILWMNFRVIKPRVIRKR